MTRECNCKDMEITNPENGGNDEPEVNEEQAAYEQRHADKIRMTLAVMGHKVGQYQPAAVGKDTEDLRGGLLRVFNVMKVHVGQGIIHEVIPGGKTAAIALPVVDVGGVTEFPFHFVEHLGRIVYGDDGGRAPSQSLADKSRPRPYIGNYIAGFGVDHRKDLFPYGSAVEFPAHGIPLRGDLVKISPDFLFFTLSEQFFK